MHPGTSQNRQTANHAGWRDQNEPLIVLYEALTARVGHRDALLWQSPALAMTAPAFLLTIALGHDAGPVARLLAAFLGLVVTFMSIQLMLKHRMYMTNDQVMMVSLERMMGIPASAIDHETQLAHLRRDLLSGRMKEKKWLTRFVSVNVWISGLGLFAIVNLILGAYAIADAFGWPCEWFPASGGAECILAL